MSAPRRAFAIFFLIVATGLLGYWSLTLPFPVGSLLFLLACICAAAAIALIFPNRPKELSDDSGAPEGGRPPVRMPGTERRA